MTERPQADPGVCKEIALAELEQPAERLQDRKVLLDCFSGKRIEHEIDAFTVGQLHDLVGVGKAAGIEDAVRPHAGQFGDHALLVVAGVA